MEELKSRKSKVEIENTKWGRAIPWLLSVACIIVLWIIGEFLIENINWYKKSVFDVELTVAQEPIYRIHAYHIHMSMIKRSIGLFSGFSIMFLGLGVAFYSIRDRATLDIKSNIWSANIATASPGIIALLVGGTIIMYTIGNKNNFPAYPVIIEDKKVLEQHFGQQNNDTLPDLVAPFEQKIKKNTNE